MTPVECIIPNESAPLCPKGSDVVFLEQLLCVSVRMCVYKVEEARVYAQDGTWNACWITREWRERERERRGMGTNSTLVPSDLPLVRFNTRAIITRYRYNGASLSRVSVFRVHVHAHTRNLCHWREMFGCRGRETDEKKREGYLFLLLFRLRWISRSRIDCSCNYCPIIRDANI